MAEAERNTPEAASELAVTVITPKGPIAELSTDAVTAPGKVGEFELLPNHLPFLTALRPGVLTLGERDKTVFAVGSGFLRVDLDGRVEILVEEAVSGMDVDPDPVQAEASEAQEELDLWNRELDADYQRIAYRHAWASARLEAHQRAKGN